MTRQQGMLVAVALSAAAVDLATKALGSTLLADGAPSRCRAP